VLHRAKGAGPKTLGFKDFYAARNRWRRGRDCRAAPTKTIKSKAYCLPDHAVCTSQVHQCPSDNLNPAQVELHPSD
jgi:hypothetical protein